MVRKRDSGSIGSWAFLIGLLAAIVLGAMDYVGPTWSLVLLIIGLVVGLLNITAGETEPFLFSGVVLIIASAFGGSALSAVPFLTRIFDSLLLLFVPATIIVAVKNVFNLARQ